MYTCEMVCRRSDIQESLGFGGVAPEPAREGAAEVITERAKAEGDREPDDGGGGRGIRLLGNGDNGNPRDQAEQQAERQPDGAADMGEVASAQLIKHSISE